MSITLKLRAKCENLLNIRDGASHTRHLTNQSEHENARKNEGGSWFNQAHNTDSGTGQNPVNGLKVPGINWSDRTKPAQGFNVTAAQRYREEIKQPGLSGRAWFDHGASEYSSRSDSRKTASALIAKIPFELSSHIARIFKPR